MLTRSDFHIHATFYRLRKKDAAIGPTVREQVDVAMANGMEKIGIVEHCNYAAHHPFHCLVKLGQEFRQLKLELGKFFLGVEADLLADGQDSCGVYGRQRLGLDYVIASSHVGPGQQSQLSAYLKEEHRRICLALAENDNVEVIGHPFAGGSRYERSGIIPQWHFGLVPTEMLDEIVNLAKKSGKALEVNYSRMEDPAYQEFLQTMREKQVLFSIGSDAHDTGRQKKALQIHAMLQQMGFQKKCQWQPKTKRLL